MLAQSHNDGWQAELADGTSLGAPDLVDGMANAWLVDPGDADEPLDHAEWTPQRRVWLGLGITALGLLLCLVLIVRRRKQRFDLASDDAPDLDPPRFGAIERPQKAARLPENAYSRRVLVGLPIAVASSAR